MQVSPPHSSLPHIVFFTQRLHGSSPVPVQTPVVMSHASSPSGPASVMLLWSHIGETAGLRMMSRQPISLHTVQQPKQSQPGGVSGPQFMLHFDGTGVWPNG